MVARAKLHKSRAINETPRRAGCGGPDTAAAAAAAKKSAIAVKGTERAGVRSLAFQRRDVSELLLVVYCGHLLRRAMRKKDAEGEERKSLRGRGEEKGREVASPRG